jgi:universal stress protein E
MSSFRNILVGIDLTQCKPLQTAALPSSARQTVDAAVWLARHTGGRLLFLSVFNLSEDALRHLDAEERGQVGQTIEQGACQVLDALVTEARVQGVQAERKLAIGKAWEHITRQAVKGGHDLVMVSTRDQTGWRRMLFGNTALKLLRRCPCPVWVAKPGFHKGPVNLLVATDLKPASQEALRLGLALAELPQSTLHVLHVIEFPLDRLGWTGLPDDKTMAYHERVRAAADKTLREQMTKLPHTPGTRVEIHLVAGDGLPDDAIHHFLHTHQIDLLIMGTIGRSGIAGIVLGNTAERLLPEVQCSVLAVKPRDFQCPVQP